MVKGFLSRTDNFFRITLYFFVEQWLLKGFSQTSLLVVELVLTMKENIILVERKYDPPDNFFTLGSYTSPVHGD